MTLKFSQHVLTEGSRNLSGKLRPSGRFSFAQIFPKKSKVLNRDKKETQVTQPVRTLQQIDDTYSEIQRGQFIPMQRVPPSGYDNLRGLGLSIAANSDIRAKRGSKGISSSARDILCWSANQLERVYRKQNMSFLTLTLPELSEADLTAVKEGWSKLVNDLVREIKRELERHGLKTSVVGCTELQLERFQSTGRSFPHVHLVFRGRHHAKSNWKIAPKRFRAIWSGCINRLDVSGTYDWSACENVQGINKSCGGYLAKYISKAQSKGQDGLGDSWHPSDWVICSRRLRTLYATLSVTGYDIAIALSEVCRHWLPGMGYKQSVLITSAAYGERKIGEWGWLKDEAKFLSPMEWFALI